MFSKRLLDYLRSGSTRISLLIACVVTAVFAKVYGFDFVCWDDDINVYGNVHFFPITLQSVLHFWAHPYESLYIPISYTVFALVGLIAQVVPIGGSGSEFSTQLNPHIFHAANLALHVINAVLVFRIVRKFVKADLPSALGALVFALHPLQVESLAWVSELRGLLSGTFALAAISEYLGEPEGSTGARRSLFAVILFALSLLAKPTVVMVPVVLFTWDSLFMHRQPRESFRTLLPWFVLAVFDVAVTHCVQPISQTVTVPVWERGIVAFDSIGFYIEKLIWPVNLAPEYGRSPQRMLAMSWEYRTIPVVVAAVLATIAFGQRRRWLLPCAMTFITFLLPVSGLFVFTFQYFSTVADRYVYLAMLGPALAVGFGLSELSTTRQRVIGGCMIGCLVTVLALLSMNQVLVWRNTTTLFTQTLSVNPYDWLPHEKLGNEDLRSNRYAEAEAQFRTVITRGPQDPKFWVELGSAVQGERRYSDAIADDNHAIALLSSCPLALYHRAQCEALTGDAGQSIADYRASVNELPDTCYAHFELAMELGSVGRLSEAAAELTRTLQLHPDFKTGYYYLAMTYAKLGRYELASDAARTALAEDPTDTAVIPFLSAPDLLSATDQEVRRQVPTLRTRN